MPLASKTSIARLASRNNILLVFGTIAHQSLTLIDEPDVKDWLWTPFVKVGRDKFNLYWTLSLTCNFNWNATRSTCNPTGSTWV